MCNLGLSCKCWIAYTRFLFFSLTFGPLFCLSSIIQVFQFEAVVAIRAPTLQFESHLSNDLDFYSLKVRTLVFISLPQFGCNFTTNLRLHRFLYNFTALQLHVFTTLQLHNFTTSQLCDLQPYDLMTQLQLLRYLQKVYYNFITPNSKV
jgi:hypothetical protein